MKAQLLLEQILPVLHSVKDDGEKLQRILDFLLAEIYEEPRESHESFKIMEWFIDEVEDNQLQNKLIYALNNRHPFSNFKALVEISEYRQQWFGFKQEKLEEMVRDEIS
jgi:hypothetical protein